MTTSRRHVLATLLLPALLLGAVYMLAVRVPLDRTIGGQEEYLATKSAQVPDLAAVTQQADELVELREQLEAAKAAAASPEHAVVTPATPSQRAAQRMRLAELLSSHDLLLTQETIADADVTPAIATLVGRDTKAARSRVPSTTLHFRGRYLDVLAVLQQLRDEKLAALPLRLEMRPSEDALLLPQWTLVLA